MNDPELKKELADIKAYCEKLRSDLSATNAALIAVFAAIPELYRDRVLEQLARRSVQRDEYAAQPIDPVAEQVLPLMAASEDRIYRELQKVAAQRRAEGVKKQPAHAARTTKGHPCAPPLPPRGSAA